MFCTKIFPWLLAGAFCFSPVSAAIVQLRVHAESITGSQTATGTQSSLIGQEPFYEDVISNGFDFIVTYDTGASPFSHSGSSGREFEATILSGTIGSRDVSTIENFSAIIRLLKTGSQTSLTIIAREQPIIPGTGYYYNEAVLSLSTSGTISETELPDIEAIGVFDVAIASSRISRNAGGVQATREFGGGPGSVTAVPEPSMAVLAFSSSLLFFRRKRSS